MKKLIFLILLLCSTPMFGQIETKTIKDGYLVYNYDGQSFKSNKKIKEGGTITLIKEFDQHPSFFIVMYKDKEYCLNKECIDKVDIEKYIKTKEDSLKNIQHREDSIKHREDSVRVSIYRRKNDSITRINHVRDSIQTKIKRDSIMNHINFILSLLDERKKLEKDMNKQGLPIEIMYITCSRPNSVGGVDLHLGFKNISNKEIKYIYLSGYPINAVKDRCYCSIKGYSTTSVTGVGPIKYGEESEYSWENTWYNRTIDKYVPLSITIEYMNGSKTSINSQQIKKLLSYGLSDETIIKRIKEEKINTDSLRKYLYEEGGYDELYKELLKYENIWFRYVISTHGK